VEPLQIFQDPLSGWVIGKIIDKAYSYGSLKGKIIFSKWKGHNQVHNWISRLNDYLGDEIKIFCQNISEPNIGIIGIYPLTKAQKDLAKKHRIRLKKINRPNDPHAIMINDPIWNIDPVNLEARTLDFASVCALRDEKIKPQILSSSAIIVCDKNKQLILHERADEVATYPSCLHTLGGAYIPPGYRGVDSDRVSLASTKTREIHEEAQLALSSDVEPPMMLSKELSTGFIQLVFLGHNILPTAAKRLKGNWEGKIVYIPFDQLPSILENPKWVPTGKAHVLSWLALDTPGCSRKPKFNGLKAFQLFDKIVNK